LRASLGFGGNKGTGSFISSPETSDFRGVIDLKDNETKGYFYF